MGVEVSLCTITLSPFDKVKRSKLTTDFLDFKGLPGLASVFWLLTSIIK